MCWRWWLALSPRPPTDRACCMWGEMASSSGRCLSGGSTPLPHTAGSWPCWTAIVRAGTCMVTPLGAAMHETRKWAMGGVNVAGGTWGMDHTSALYKAAWRCVACGAFYSSPPLTGTSMTTVVSTAESTVDISTPTLHMNFVLSFSWVVHASGRLPHTRARRGPLDLSRQGGGTPMRPRIRGCGMGVNMMTRKDCLSSDMHL